jgi:hypothetical protein
VRTNEPIVVGLDLLQTTRNQSHGGANALGPTVEQTDGRRHGAAGPRAGSAREPQLEPYDEGHAKKQAECADGSCSAAAVARRHIAEDHFVLSRRKW